MRTRILSLFLILLLPTLRAADPAPFEVVEGDRVLLLGDTLLERENTYGYLETRMHEQFPDRHFTVRNLSWAGDTPRGVSRASFDGPEKGWERLKESIALVKPTVVFLGYGMAASLQEMTDRAQDITLNRDETRYGAEPYSVVRFKKEMGDLMDAIGKITAEKTENAENAEKRKKDSVSDSSVSSASSALSAVKRTVRFVLLSPIRHEDLRAVKPGLPDPAPHNALLEQYTKAIEELAKEKEARFLPFFIPSSAEFFQLPNSDDVVGIDPRGTLRPNPSLRRVFFTENGIHLNELGFRETFGSVQGSYLGWSGDRKVKSEPLRTAVLKKNELFFHRFRPENATYLFGFRKHEQGQNAKEIPMFDPLIDAAEAEIDKIKRAKSASIDPAGKSDLPRTAKTDPSENEQISPKSSPRPSQLSPRLLQLSPRLSQKNAPPAQTNPIFSAKNDLSAKNTAHSPQLSPQPSQLSPQLRQLSPRLGENIPPPAQNIPHSTAENPASDCTPPVLLAQNPPPAPTTAAPAIKGPIDAPTPPPLPDFTVQEGYQIELWAQNPLLEKPTQMNWDALGRLWVCSSSLYPQIEPGQAANDKILILEDTDRDGRADRSTIFADGLLIPTAVVPDLVRSKKSSVGSEKAPAADSALTTDNFSLTTSPSACYVGQSTELLYFEDTDGDGKADQRRVVFSGFGTEDTHHIIHTLKWGPDGRLYFNQSIYIHSHLETPWGMVRLNSAGVFAYDPRTERVEVLFKGLCNPWGLAWDQWGQAFMTDGAGGGGINWGIPGAMYFTYENGRRIAPSISPGSYPKFASLELIHSPMFPEWEGNAVTNDFRAHRIVRFSIEDLAVGSEKSSVVSKKSEEPAPANPPLTTANFSLLTPPRSGYETKEQPDLVRTNDQSFRPIDIRLGPDGALYIADWSNPVINHGEVDFRDPRRDHHMGRIWRISKKDTPPVKWEPLVGKKTEDLLWMLLGKSSWEQEQARRVIIGRGYDATKGDLNYFVLTQFSKQDGPQSHRLHFATRGLVQAFGLASFGEFLSKDVAPQVRAGAARTLGNRYQTLKDLGDAGKDRNVGNISVIQLDVLPKLAADVNPRVRLEAMRALSRIPTAQSAALVLEAALNSPGEAGAVNARGEEKGGQFDKSAFSDTKDPYYGYAAWLSINDLAKPWTDAIASGAWQADTAERQQQLAWGLKNIDPALASATLSRLVTENKVPLDGSGPWIELLGQAGGAKEIDRLWARVQEKKTEETTTPRILAALTEAALLRNVRPTQPVDSLANYLDSGHAQTVRTATRLAGAWKMESTVPRLVALTTGPDDAARNYAFEALRGIGTEPARAALRQLAAAPNPPPIRGQAVAALAALDLNPALTFDALAAQPAEDAALAVWRGVLGVKDAADKLAASIPKEMPKPVAMAGLRAAREAGKNGAKLLAALTPLAGVSDAEAKMPKDFTALAGFAKQNGDPARGELIYRRAALACTVCHAIGGAGGKVGPDMTSLGASAPLDYIIESVINPAAKVKEGYNAVTLALKDGTQATGIQARETAQEVFLRDVTGHEQAIAKAQITGTTNVGSIMPAGLTDQLQDRERLDLFAFLGELGKPGPYDASKGSVARVWRLFSGADAAKVIGSETPLDSAMPGYTLVDGRFVKDLLTASAPMVTNGADTMMAVAQFQSTGKTRLKLTGAGKVWLDGKPLALSDDLAPELTAGVHTLAVKLDVKTLPEYLRAESPDARFLGN